MFPGGETENLKFIFKGSEKAQIDKRKASHLSQVWRNHSGTPIAWTQMAA